MEPFLSQVARAYLQHERGSIMDCCFVFPNKRSGTFFRHYLHTLSRGTPLVMPQISTIGEVAASFASLSEAPRIEQLFQLYDCYRRLSGGEADFDRFMFWGEMILSDFNDVDMYLVDAGKLFVNLKRYREVSADYLTPEQKDILERYWGETFHPQSPDTFWQHLHADCPTTLEQKFLQLWEVLAPLYRDYTEALRSRGLGNQGMIMRQAVETLRAMDASVPLPCGRYVFVGFNVLTLSEVAILESLDARGCADFYWDTASPVMNDTVNAASRFIHRNVRRFRSRYDLQAMYPAAAGASPWPEIHLTGVPSATAQAQMADRQLQQWIDRGVIDPADPSPSTAIVMPDESLLVPMVHQVPPQLTQINITMGLPVRTTSFASFIGLIVGMHLRATESKGEWSYFYDDVRKVITHPLLTSVDAGGCDAVMRLFMEQRIYMLPASKAIATAPVLEYVFTPIGNTDSEADVYGYFRRLLATLHSRLTGAGSDTAVTQPADGADGTGKAPHPRQVELYFTEAYAEALEQLHRACLRWDVALKDTTFIQMLQKVTAGASVSFTGEPLRGLQLMGVLETRALDFDNLILLSMNERIFPRKHYTRSFIPDNLRRSYGMATTDFQESIYAYYFYRLISRAGRVSIYYDSRNGPTYTAEISRYLIQLMYLHPECRITHTLGSYALHQHKPLEITMPRTADIQSRLREFLPPGSRCLSATAINDYINCPLQFLLKHVYGLNTDTDNVDYMDAGTYGTIVHAVVQRVYMEWKGNAGSVKVTPAMLDQLCRPHSRLERYITEAVNDTYGRRGRGDATPLAGEARVMGNLIHYFLVRMFTIESSRAPFDFIDAEHLVKGTMALAPDLTVNIKQYIDRIDRIYPPGHYGDPLHGTVRVVDYKTGVDELTFGSMDDLFDPDKDDRRKAILQLLFYCKAYARETGDSGPIQPYIYRMRRICTEGLTPLKYNGRPLEDYREVEPEFMQRFEALIRRMLLSDEPFVQASTDHHCKLCRFQQLCRR